MSDQAATAAVAPPLAPAHCRQPWAIPRYRPPTPSMRSTQKCVVVHGNTRTDGPSAASHWARRVGGFPSAPNGLCHIPRPHNRRAACLPHPPPMACGRGTAPRRTQRRPIPNRCRRPVLPRDPAPAAGRCAAAARCVGRGRVRCAAGPRAGPTGLGLSCGRALLSRGRRMDGFEGRPLKCRVLHLCARDNPVQDLRRGGPPTAMGDCPVVLCGWRPRVFVGGEGGAF